MDSTEKFMVELLKEGDERAYRYLYDRHYPILCHVAAQYVGDDFLAGTIVSDVIFHLWEIRERLSIESSLRSFLVQSVRNRCLDYLRSQQVEREQSVPGAGGIEALPVVRYLKSDDSPLGKLLEEELEERVHAAIRQLPEECRKVFRLSRFEGKRNEEIAQELGISVNTVKYHIKRALALLHEDLREYLSLAVLLLLHNGMH